MAANPERRQALARSDAEVFSFLDLPAESRNNIYRVTLQDASHTIIHGVNLPRSPHGRFMERRPPSGDRMFHMPFLGLSQTCKAIRDEYRPLYIGDQAVPVSAVTLYMYAFVEHPRKRWNAAFNVFSKSVGRLRITIDDAAGIDLLQLLRLKALHSACKVEVRSSRPEHDARIAPLVHLINNQNKTWLHLVKDGQVHAARLTTWYFMNVDNIRLRIELRTLTKATSKFSNELYQTEWVTLAVDRRQIGMECPGLLINVSYTD